MRAHLIRLLVGLPLLLGLPAAHAQMYVLPEATGNGSGSDWANARGAGGGGLQAAWDAAGRVGEVRLGSGDYRDVTLRIQEGGLGADRLRRLVGVDTGAGLPRILSDFDRHRPSDTGGTFVLAHTGASHFSVQGFRIEDHRTGISLRGGHQNVTLAGLDIQRARDGIVVRGGATDTQRFRRTTGVRVEDTRIRDYTKRGVRIRDGVRGMEVVNTHVDGGGIDWATERFAMGFHVHSDVAGVYNENISFIDSSAQNHVDPNGNAYWNADGFVTDTRSRGIQYIRAAAYNNTDGGFDDKSEAPTYIDTVSMGNKYNYRFWNQGATLTNSLSAYPMLHGGSGGPGAGMQLLVGATATAERFTFIDDEGYALELREDTVLDLINSILAVEDAASFYRRLHESAEVNLQDVIEHILGHAATDPLLRSPGPGADPFSDAFNSQRYPSLGYHVVPEPASAAVLATLLVLGCGRGRFRGRGCLRGRCRWGVRGPLP